MKFLRPEREAWPLSGTTRNACVSKVRSHILRLVATVGSNQYAKKKIGRKTILDVNVPNTCDKIIHPQAPMALRLQSNLLYGVSRVFSQQSGYLLSDAQQAQTNMRALLKAVRTSELDPNAGKARPEQLLLQDDPAFSADFDTLNFDMAVPDFSTNESSRRSSILSQHSQPSSRSSQHSGQASIPGLIIPSGESSIGDIGGFQLPSEQASSVQRSERLGRLLEDGEAFNFDPGFSFDAEGNWIEEPVRRSVEGRQEVRGASDAGVSGQVSGAVAQSPQAQTGQAGAVNAEFGILPFDDGPLFQDAEPFPTAAPDVAGHAEQQRSPPRAQEDDDYADAAAAPLRRRKPKARIMPLDQRMELKNADLAGWKDNYKTNMAETVRAHQHHQAPHFTKKNAAQFVTGFGIGSAGIAIGGAKLANPLAMFAGDSLMRMLTGIAPAAGRKRDRGDVSGDETDSEVRRQRMRGEEAQVGLGDDMPLLSDDMDQHIGDDIEIGRHASRPLADDPTFPWNTTASALSRSRQGSSIARGHHGSIGGLPSSVVRVPSINPLDRRASRLPSASPLVGRGSHRFSSLEIPYGSQDEDLAAEAQFSEDYQPFASDDQSFQLHGPAAAVGTQTQAQRQWIEATLDREAHNFLDFLREEIVNLPAPAIEISDDEDQLASRSPPVEKKVVEFEALLPPGEHSSVVAAQALHHVLALATKNLLDVEQVEPFGSIRLGISAGI